VQQQLGPMPPATASPGMILQYNTMLSERKRSLVVDNINGLIENAAALLVKVRSTARAIQGCQKHLAVSSNCSHSSWVRWPVLCIAATPAQPLWCSIKAWACERRYVSHVMMCMVE